MPISSERFDEATELVETCVDIASYLLQQPRGSRPSAVKTLDFITDALRADGQADLTIDGLLEVLGVAAMIIAFERVAQRSYLDA